MILFSMLHFSVVDMFLLLLLGDDDHPMMTMNDDDYDDDQCVDEKDTMADKLVVASCPENRHVICIK